MKRYLPHIHWGGSSDECTRDQEGGREGYYFQICWLGWMFGLTFSSLRWERRLMAEIRAERGGSQ